MLEKNKDYVEFTLQCTTVERSRDKDYREVCFNGYSNSDFPGVPMDVVCKEFDHKVVMISKRDFEKMQANANINAELAKQWEINYDLLLKKIGFDTVEELVNYLDSEAECDTLREAIASLEHNVKFARDERRDLSKKLDECEKDYISERDKAEALKTENEQLKKKLAEFSPAPGYREFLKALYPEATEATIEKLIWTTGQLCCGRDLPNALQTDLEYYRSISSAQAKSIYSWKEATGCSTPEEAKELINGKKRHVEKLQEENEQLKKKLAVPDPFAEYKELFEKLRSKEDVEKFEWTLNHICGGQASANGWMVTAKLWRRNYEALSKLVGFSSTEEIQDYLTNEAECDTLQEAISKLKDQVKYTCEEWYSANSRNNSWKAAAECNSPKELIEKREALEKEIGICSRTLNEWKEGTGCQSPSLAKTLIESGMSYEYAYHESQKENRKLTDDVESWKNVTGYSTPEDYMHARISGAFHTPFDYTVAWQKSTGCDTPEQAKSHIEEFERIVRLTNKNMLSTLDSEIDEWQKFTGCDSPQKAGCKINDLCDEICKLKGDYDRLLKLTGYKSEDSIRVALTYSEQFVYETMRELINSLKRKAEFTESNWQAATGCDAPDDAETTIRNLRGRIDEIKEFAAIASNWTDRIVED